MTNFAHLLEIILRGELVPEKDLVHLLWAALVVFQEEPTVLSLPAPVSIFGDIHGQFYDLRKILEVVGPVPSRRYLFLGDYVDRGYHSVETINLLLCLKVCYPNHVFLLRGNHETRAISQAYSFFDEVLSKYGRSGPYKLYMDVFDALPIAGCVDGRYYCVHGGLTPRVPLIDDVHTLMRHREPISGDDPCHMSDILWSDPSPNVEEFKASGR
ncbi:hypothetical protein KIPB_012161, partial [Kipferlia bialata]|eukprot:g12161.t1